MNLRRRRKRREDQAGRTAEAKAAGDQAREETAKSQWRHDTVRENVINPMTAAGQHNQFAQMIRNTLLGDNGGNAGR